MNPSVKIYYALLIVALALALVSIPAAVIVATILLILGRRIVLFIQQVWFAYDNGRDAQRYRRYVRYIKELNR